ncbi:T9SS type A sorting domain-containing protein [Winogradskyella sp. PG-2]|uniref:T9SS type A sorting domain-containing protein n=1 Tax=Winogradskyella sp. PG-2 TaxID=754409 RepID=UPI001E4523E0|nr:T9SS type A sorting domain-containing protein [Winogradskyella sp. PG-2]
MTEITKLITVYLATAAGFDPTLSNAELSNSEVIIFPNPVSSVLNVSNNSLQDLKISIYDITGKLIKSKESNSQNIELDVRQNRTGVYFVNVASETKSSTYKIVKE